MELGNGWYCLTTGDIPKHIDCAELMRVWFIIDSDWRLVSVWINGVPYINLDIHLNWIVLKPCIFLTRKPMSSVFWGWQFPMLPSRQYLYYTAFFNNNSYNKNPSAITLYWIHFLAIIKFNKATVKQKRKSIRKEKSFWIKTISFSSHRLHSRML